ncbi:Ankyrin-3 [Quillaja saponaria]|uniref:Ankyrin-3 n=1 Tax=Quillaja saponaria TaxID=32244 RepID=A0AAD7P8C3_QUISA|nr:Ankyrin-3 [Quillaja saponaria]
MTVFGNSGNGLKKQVFPIDCETEASQCLVDYAHVNDTNSALECITNPFVDVNFVGTVSLKSKKTEILLHDESAHEFRVEYEEFKTNVTALFLASHSGNLVLVRKLLSVGANVNLRLFKGYATTAAVREGHLQILEVLTNAGASQQACEEALLEATFLGQARSAQLLMGSNMIRPQTAIHALVSACCRGFVDIVDILIKCEVDANATDRMLLQSSKPFLHANVDCNALFAAIVSRQVAVVRLLLQAGVRMDIKVRLGAWSWDMDTGEELRVGAGLAEAYSVTWCAVEYFEASGAILQMLLHHLSPNSPHYGRTLIHHAILCNNEKAVNMLLNNSADAECVVKTIADISLRPIHMAAMLGRYNILHCLIKVNINSQTKWGDTALMICTKYKHEECLKILASAGADLGLVNSAGHCATLIAGLVGWSLGFQDAILDVIRAGKLIKSSDASRFAPLPFVIRANDMEALKKLIEQPDINLDEQDDNGFSAAMVAAAEGHIEAFRLLVYAGVDIKLTNRHGQTAIDLSEANQNVEAFEKVIVEYELENGCNGSIGIYALHRASRHGDIDFVHMLTSKDFDVNAFDGDGYTPLMLAAREGYGNLCQLLISCGARCDTENERQETALLLARKNGRGNNAEHIILDELARKLVLSGAQVKKHTKCGKGSPHYKVLRMLGTVGVLRWGKSNRRNIVCKGAEIGPSAAFRWNRRRKFDIDDPGMFHVVTTKSKEVHFVCEGGVEMAELWVRGIGLVTRKAIFGKKN